MKKLSLLLAVLALVVTACGAAIENVSEELIEQAAEQGGGGEVEIDFDDEGVSVSVQNDDGNFAIGSDLDLPDGLTIPLPSGGNITTAGSDGSYTFASVQFPGDRYDELAAFYEDWTSNDGQEWSYTESTTDMSGTKIRTIAYYADASGITVSDCVTATSDGSFDSVCVTINESK